MRAKPFKRGFCILRSGMRGAGASSETSKRSCARILELPNSSWVIFADRSAWRRLETVDRYGLETLLAVFAQKQDTTERRVRAAVARWPDGVAQAEALMEGDGPEETIRCHVRVEKHGDRLLFDFTGSSDQTTMPINVRPSVVRGCCYYALIGMLDPGIENNGGLARVVETRLRPGSVLDPVFPAPTNAYMTTAAAVTEAIIAALSELARERQVAGVGGVGALAFAGRRADGTRFQTY